MGVIEEAKALLEQGKWVDASVLLDVPRASMELHGYEEDDETYVKRLKAVVGVDQPTNVPGVPAEEGATDGGPTDQATTGL